MLSWLLGLPRFIKRFLSVFTDVIFLTASITAAYLLTNSVDILPYTVLMMVFALSLPITLLVFVKLGLYRAVIRYIGQHALGAVMAGIVTSAMVNIALFTLWGFSDLGNLIFVYALLALVSSGGGRLLARLFLAQRNNKHKQRVLIYGAGSAGRQLALSLFSGDQHHPVMFVDDDVTLQRSSILGIAVGNPSQIHNIVNAYNISKVLLAIPSVSRLRRREVLDRLESLSIPVQSIPGMNDIVDGSMRIDDLQDVKIEDLLGRDPVEPKVKLMHANIRGKVVMVTGAGGSIGSELCRQIIRYEPEKLVLFESSEYALYSIEQELSGQILKLGLDFTVAPVLGNVLHANRMQAVMTTLKVNTVYHAAAYKHVPLVEFNVVEGIRNNVFGTLHTAEAAIAAGVEQFVLISTDKAVRPTSVMGASKRLAELVLQALASSKTNTRFCMVRFGNVLGSSGSVVPLFREQILKGGPVTVTHRNIIRFFMTIPEAAQLVIQAGAMAKGGDVFVLDMGEAVKIDDLAKRIIHLMGLEVKDELHPYGDIEIHYTGLRPGEKLYEELLIGESVQQTEHPRIMTANEVSLEWPAMSQLLSNLDKDCNDFNVSGIINTLLTAPVSFNFNGQITDLLAKPADDDSVKDTKPVLLVNNDKDGTRYSA